MKHLCSLLCTLALLAGLTGCGGERPPPTIRVGVALYQQNDTFISTVVQDLQRLALEEEQARNIKINLNITDGHSSQSLQNEQVDRFLDRNYDVICVNIVDRTAAAVIIDKAQASGVPVIFFNREPVEEDLRRWNRAYYVGSPAGSAGVLQGGIVLDAWQEGGLDRNGDGILQYVMLEGEPGHQDSLLRTEYCIKALTDEGVAVEKLAGDAANWNRGQAAARMEQWLQEFGEGIEVVFSNNDDMALGAIDAIREWGGPGLMVVGVDATAPALEAVETGELYGTVLNDGRGIARAMLDLALALADGREASEAVDLQEGHYVWLPGEKIGQELPGPF